MADIYAEADRLGKEADALFEKNVDAAMLRYRQAWAACPEPKHEWDGVTWIWGMIAGRQIEQGQLRDAIESLRHVEQSRYIDQNSSALFDLGRAHYELGEFNNARRYFQRAWDVSEGRAFRGEDIKYARFLKDKRVSEY